MFSFQVTYDLSPKKLIELVQHISPQHMRTLAIMYLGLEPPVLDNFQYSRPDDASGFKFDIIYNWACRPGNNRKVIIRRFGELQSFRRHLGVVLTFTQILYWCIFINH